jgi:hypothetical protein
MNDIQERIAVSFKSQGLMATLGAHLVSVAHGEVQIELPFSKHISQQHGYVHAGAITSVGGCHHAGNDRQCSFVTPELSFNRPVQVSHCSRTFRTLQEPFV